MSAISLSPTRRELLAATAAAGAISLLPEALRAGRAGDSIRPFTANIPQDDITELRRRIAATRWPDRETVPDGSQGVQLTKLQDLVRYWGTSYDWRKGEAKLNAYPQFVTEIDGLDIHFIHVRSPHMNALPLIMTHGWPGSVFELLKTIGPLTDPTAHGGRAEDAFHLVLPSMPGYGFSGKPTETGWDPDRIARAWAELMKRLGYTRYVAQGGDWGAPVSSAMARQAPAGLLGIHINLPATVPPEVAAVLASGGPAPAGPLREGTRGVRLARYVPQDRRRRLQRDDGRAAAGDRLWLDGTLRRALRRGCRASGFGSGYMATSPSRLAHAKTRCWTTLRCTG